MSIVSCLLVASSLLFLNSCTDENKSTVATVTTTSPATAITQTGASVGGNIVTNGGAAVTESGVVFGTAANPVITGSKVATSPNVTTGTFTVSLTGLTSGSNYFARAYAKNSVGVSYGSEITFATPALEFFTNRAAWGFEQTTFPNNAEITTFSFPSGQATAAIDATSGANGTSKSLQVTFAQAVEFQLNTWTFFGPADGKTYTLSYWIKGSATTNNSGLQTWLRRPDNTGQVLFDGGSSLNITTSWQKVSFDFTAPAGSTNLVGWRLQLKIVTSPASGSISFDEFSIVEKN